MKKYIQTPAARLRACCLVTALCISVAAAASAAKTTDYDFDRTLKLNNISFHVTCANQGSLNDLTIVPKGLEIDNTVISRKDIDGTVTGAEVADINQDGSPEIYVYVTSAGSGSYGSLIGYSANNNKSLSEIYLPPLEDDKLNSKGYMGHDSFKVEGDRLVRSFPLYRDNDSNANPTGPSRRLDYALVPGEATWQLKLVKSTDQPPAAP